MLYFPDEIRSITKKIIPKKIITELKTTLPESILFDINKIPKLEIDNDIVIHDLVEGHRNQTLAIIHYEKLISLEPKKIPLEK